MFDWSTIFPARRNDYVGHRFSLYFVILIALRNTFRGCVHYFAPDGGSGIIAGLPLATYSEDAVLAIVNSFGVYGIGHLLEAAMVWLVIFRYRRLIPLVYLYLLVSQLLGIGLFVFKPLPVVPPGQVAMYVLLPVTFGFFLLSLKRSASADR